MGIYCWDDYDFLTTHFMKEKQWELLPRGSQTILININPQSQTETKLKADICQFFPLLHPFLSSCAIDPASLALSTAAFSTQPLPDWYLWYALGPQLSRGSYLAEWVWQESRPRQVHSAQGGFLTRTDLLLSSWLLNEFIWRCLSHVIAQVQPCGQRNWWLNPFWGESFLIHEGHGLWPVPS